MEHEAARCRLPPVSNAVRPGANLLSRLYIPREIATVSPTARKYENVTYNESESFKLSNIFLFIVSRKGSWTANMKNDDDARNGIGLSLPDSAIYPQVRKIRN
ncbi:MAG: hypothetical protein K2H94_00185, partial [Duncaniella sp.]|nr:hypothetical protein [Duncaniella sp.]